MRFETALETMFPGALPTVAFVGRAQATLARIGFSGRSALPVVVMCSDEITDALRQDLRRAFGPPFDAACLAGVPLLGRTVFAAAAGHVPVVGGRGRLMCFAITHVGLGPAGEVGWCERPGREAPGVACGALAALRDDVAAGGDPVRSAADDPQYRWLAEQVVPRLPAAGTLDLAALARLALDVSASLLEHHLTTWVDPATVDWVLLTGVQVHGPSSRDYVWPSRGLVSVAGQRSPLTFG